jgi:beta-lactamase class A
VKLSLCCVLFLATCLAQTAVPSPSAGKQKVLWQKLESHIQDVDAKLDGVMGVAIEDLTTGDHFLLHEDEVFAQASSIKVTVLATLYLQAQQGKLKLTDLYTVQSSDLVPDSDIMNGLTPGVTRLTLRDLATMMVAVSDNSAANVLIDRVGMPNVNAMLDSLGLTHTRLRRKMMDLQAAKEGRENISTPREMMTLLDALYHGKLLNKESTTDFFTMLSTNKNSFIPRDLPADLKVANKEGELEAVRTDSGIVFVEGRPYVICVMTSFLRNERDGEEAITKVSLEAWRMFDRLSRATEYGRVVSRGNGTR